MYKTFGETIASLRRAHGMRQQTLADALAEAGVPVSNQAVSKWENDATLPNAQQFLTLCRVLDVDDIAGTFSGGDAGGLLAGLNAEGRRRALEYIALLRESKRFAAAPEPAALRSLPLYSLAVSAGTGQFLDGESYEMQPVGPEVPEAVRALLGSDAEGLCPPEEGVEGKFLVDLKETNRRRLLQLGLAPEHIDVSPDCTMCMQDVYWSHRATKGRRGTMASVIML